MGDSILMTRNDETWSKKRKALSVTFYKDKLVKYFELIKAEQLKHLQIIREKFVNTNTPVDIISEASKAHIRVLLKCAFGIDLSNQVLDWEQDGKVYQKTLDFVLIEAFHQLFMRVVSPQILIFPGTYDLYLTPAARRLRRNVERLRKLFQRIVDERKVAMQQPDYVETCDLLSTLLQDDLFKNDSESIINECLTMFFAGTQTVSITTSNLIQYLLQQPHYIQKIRDEYKQMIVDPFVQNNDAGKEVNLDNMMTIENIYDLKFYIQCFNESLRMEPPVKASTSCMLLEDLDLMNYKIKRGTPF